MTYAPRFISTFAVLLILTVPPIRAQTPATTVKDSDDNVVLQSNADGGLLAPGTFGTGTIPAEGAGTRLMWHPAKGAFRAGRVGQSKDGTQWDDSKVGLYSVAFGLDTKATGGAATAMGYRTSASGNQSMAMGGGTDARGDQSTAIGGRTVASGRQSTAMGLQTTASGTNATAMGRSTTAATDASLSIGRYTQANQASDNSLLVAGNGSSSSRSDALRLDRSGNLTISGTLTENSDRRLKTAITPLGDSTLAKLAELRPVRYAFKNQDTHPSGEQLGLIAQDVRKEFPQLVSEGSDGMLSLAYPKLTAVLVKGLQEQQVQIGRQKSRLREKDEQIATLRTNQKQIRKRLAALESQARPAAAGWMGGVPLRSLALLLIGSVLGAGLLHLRHR